MKFVLRSLIIGIVVALINVGLAFVFDVRLVWILTVSLFLIGMEDVAVVSGIVSGVFFDLMMHGNIGQTSLVILVAAVLVILSKSIGFVERSWQKIIVGFFVLLVAFLVDILITTLLIEGKSMTADFIITFVDEFIINYFLFVIVFFLVSFWKAQVPEKNVVKI